MSDEEIDLWSPEINLWSLEKILGRPVLGKILVLPMSSAIQFKCDKEWACISIFGSEVSVPPKIDDGCKNVLRLKFDDIEFKRPDSNLLEFSDFQAIEVLNFSKDMWNQIDLMMIHCAAGISRSTAVAKVISEIYQPEFSQYYSQFYSPNNLVYGILQRNRKNFKEYGEENGR